MADTQCVNVPQGKKIVLVPKYVPVRGLIWKSRPATLPEGQEVNRGDVVLDGICEAYDDPDCICLDPDQLVISPSSTPAYCDNYPFPRS